MRNGLLGLVVLASVLVQVLIVGLYWFGSLLLVPRTTTTTKGQVTIRRNGNNTNDDDASSVIDFSTLRLDYANLEVQSPLAKVWHNHQHNCQLPMAYFKYRNRYGLGSDVHVWTQALCNSVQRRVRIRTENPWIYVDQDACSSSSTTGTTAATATTTNASPASSHGGAMDCYFPRAEPRCPSDDDDDDHDVLDTADATQSTNGRPLLYTGNGMVSRGDCTDVLTHYNASLADLRASGIEFLFSGVSALVIQEANRQLTSLFNNNSSQHPSILVTVHIRWGDKKREDRPRPIAEYVDAVHDLLRKRYHVVAADRINESDTATTNAAPGTAVGIFLATEDPKAVEAFQLEAAKHRWNVYVDMYHQEFKSVRDGSYNGNPRMTQQLKGRPGLVALASLLVALQSNDFVLTTSSNWSRLINELRTHVIDPRCNHCTRMIDLSPGEW